MEKAITFGGKEYTAASLQKMSIAELLSLRNLIASNLGVATVKSFANQEVAVSATAAALKKYEDTVNEETKTAAGDAGPATAPAPKEPKAPRETPKCYSAEVVKRPSERMFSRIKKIGLPNKAQRPFAWDSFTDGMRLIDIKEDPKLHAGKISFWMRQTPPLIELVPIPKDEYEAEVAAWYVKHGYQNPADGQKKKDAEKAEIEAKRVALKEKKDKEAADKKAAAEKAKADKEAEKKAAADKKAADAAAKKAVADKAAADKAAAAAAAAKAPAPEKA